MSSFHECPSRDLRRAFSAACAPLPILVVYAIVPRRRALTAPPSAPALREGFRALLPALRRPCRTGSDALTFYRSSARLEAWPTPLRRTGGGRTEPRKGATTTYVLLVKGWRAMSVVGKYPVLWLAPWSGEAFLGIHDSREETALASWTDAGEVVDNTTWEPWTRFKVTTHCSLHLHVRRGAV